MGDISRLTLNFGLIPVPFRFTISVPGFIACLIDRFHVTSQSRPPSAMLVYSRNGVVCCDRVLEAFWP